MKLLHSKSGLVFTALIVFFCRAASAQNVAGNVCGLVSGLGGVYKIDVENSDRLYSVIENATSNVPSSEQQQFFMDLTVRLTPPDLLAIECLGNRVSLGSSRAQRIDFTADGVTRSVRNAGGQIVRSRITLERGSLIFTSSGGDDNLNFTFTPFDGGRRLRVTRRISSRELTEPVVVQTVYEKFNDVVRWNFYGERGTDSQTARQNTEKSVPSVASRKKADNESSRAESVRRALNQWIDATNARDIEKQMSFYMSELKAFYLARNASLNAVRAEKNRAFSAAKSINISAAEPEIIFQDGGQTAIMRFRKKYSIDSGSKVRSGEVVQELRWRQTKGEWKIFSERDIKVIR